MSPVHIEPTSDQKVTEFAELFEKTTSKTQKMKEGELVKGKVVAIDRDVVIVDVGMKSEGIIPIDEFKSYDGGMSANVGDEIEVFVDSVNDETGAISLSKERADGIKAWDTLVEKSKGEGVVEGKVVAKVKGGLSVDIGVKAFLPASQADLRPPKNLEQYVGNIYQFKIIKINRKRGNVVLSRKAVLEVERESMKEETLKNLSEGQVFDGITKNITDYGVFVDIGGIDGLLHVTDMSWGRLNHPSEMVKVGDGLRVVVLKYDQDSQKVSLGLKQLQADPWTTVKERYQIGNKVKGRVVSLTDYGAFVSLEDGVEGLIHVSEMSWTRKVKHPSKILSVGETVEALVLDVDTGSRRISLGLKQIMPNPWRELEDKYPIGSKIKGQIRNIADFGVFVEVGEIDGLVHVSDLDWIQNYGHIADAYKKGQELEAVVLHIDPEGEKFSLGVKHLLDDPWDQINARYQAGTEVEAEVFEINSGGAVLIIEEGVYGLIPKSSGGDKLEKGIKVKAKVKKAEQRDRAFHLEMIGEETKEDNEEVVEVKEEEKKEVEEVKVDDVEVAVEGKEEEKKDDEK